MATPRKKMPTRKTKAPKKTDDDWRDKYVSGEGRRRSEAFLFNDPGDYIVGKVLSYSEGYEPTYLKAAYPILVVHDEESDEIRSVHILQPTLLSQFRKAQPQIGERVCIRFNGMRENRAKTFEYKDFSVDVQREGSDSVPDFDSYMREDAPEDDDGLPF